MTLRRSEPSMEIDGPVTWGTMRMFQTVFGLNNKTMCFIFSIALKDFRTFISSDDEVPPDMAILVRLYVANPDMIIGREVNVAEFYHTEVANYVRLRTFSALFGLDTGRGESWVEKGTKPSPRPMAAIALARKVPLGVMAVFDAARSEADARGVNPFITGSWSEKVPEEISARYFKADDLKRDLPRGRAARQPGAMGVAPSYVATSKRRRTTKPKAK